MYLHKRVWTRSYSQINFNSSAFLAVNGAFSRSRSSILAMLKFSSATYCSLIRRLTGDRVKRVCSSSLLLLLLDGGGGGAVAAACRLHGVGRPVSVGVAAVVGVAATATVADGVNFTTCSWFRATGLVLVLLSLVAGADLFSSLAVRIEAFGLALFED